MSKLTKLIKNPKLFFIDAVKKRLKVSSKNPADLKTSVKKAGLKTSVKKAGLKTSDKSSITFETYQVNTFYPYKIILHTGEGENGITHLNLWIPIFQKSGINFVVFVRNYEVFKYVKEKYEELPIIIAKSDKEVKKILDKMQSLKACFYPSNTGNNLHLLSYNDIKHIFIGHGDSDKTASAHKYFRVYDENWVAGQAHIDRFNNAGFDHTGLRHIKVGRPNLKETLLLTQDNWKNRFGGKINLLYLSTWEGVYKEQEYTSVEVIKEFFKDINEILSEVYIKIKLHPWLGKRRRELVNYDIKILNDWNSKIYKIFEEFQNKLKRNFNILYRYPKNLEITNLKFSEINATLKIYSKETPVEKLIKFSNIFICDISAVISEALAGNGPIFVYIPKNKPIKTLKSKMDYEDYTYTFSNIEELKEKFYEVVIKGNDYLADKREMAVEYILGKKETLNDKFIQNLQCIEKDIEYDF